MATIGLKINPGYDATSGTDLSGLASVFFGDPEREMKLRLGQSQLSKDQSYMTNAAATTANTEEKTREAKITYQRNTEAGDAFGATEADRVKMPVPVEVEGPMPGTVNQNDSTIRPRYVNQQDIDAAERQRTFYRKYGPALFSRPGNPAQLSEGVNRAHGANLWEFGATPAEQRVGAGLATGDLPTTTTVVAPGDTAGTDAAAAAAIATESAKPKFDTVSGQPVRRVADPTSPSGYRDIPIAGGPQVAAGSEAEDKRFFDQENAKLQDPNYKPTVEDATRFSVLRDARFARKEVTEVDPKTGREYTRPVEGDAPGIWSGDDALRRAGASLAPTTSPTQPQPQPASAQPAAALPASMFQPPAGVPAPLQPLPPTQVPTIAVQSQPAPVTPIVDPNDAAPAQPQPAPVASTQPAATAAPGDAVNPNVAEARAIAAQEEAAAASGQRPAGRLTKMPTRATNDYTTKYQRFATGAVNALPYLDSIKNAGQIPDVLNVVANLPEGELRADVILRAFSGDPRTQEYMQQALSFLMPILRGDTGAAITKDELSKGLFQYIPLPGDTGRTLELKQGTRDSDVNSYAVAGWGKDTPEYRQFMEDAKARGVDLSFRSNIRAPAAGETVPGPDNGTQPAAAATTDAAAKEAKRQELLKRYGK